MNPIKMDKVLRDSWQAVYRGSVSEVQDLITNYLSTYAPYVCTAPSTKLSPIQALNLMYTCTHTTQSASGMDTWTPKDFSCLPLFPFEWLAKLLNLIEEGRPWPTPL